MEYLFGVLGFLFIVSFIVHLVGYFYLEIANGYDSFPFFKVSFDMFTFYDKKVKPKHNNVVKITDLSLRVMIIIFFVGILLSLATFMF